MRNPLFKRVPRELMKNAGRYCSVFLLLVATIMVGSSFMAVLESMDDALKTNQIEARVEDGQFEVYEELDEETLEELKDFGLEIVDNRYITIEEFDSNATLRIYANREEINTAAVFEGELPKAENEIAMDRLFAQNRGISLGDTVTIDGKKMIMTATISLPDYNSLFKDNSSILMETQNFGPCVVTQEGLDSFEGAKLTNLYSYRFTESDLTDNKEEEIAKDCVECLMKKGIQVVSLLPADQNQGIMFLVNDMGKDGPMITVLIYIFIAVLAFVFAVLISNTIEKEAQIIGTLRANGYTKSEMVVHYLLPTVIVAVAGSAIGNLLGYTVMIRPFIDIYYTTYCFPPCTIHFSTKAFILTTIIPIVIMVIINYLTLKIKLSLSPLRFLRNDIKAGGRKKAIKLPPVSFFNRFRLRVMIQNKSSYLILFIGIFLSSFLLMFGIGMKPLIEHYTNSVDDTLTYNYQYILKSETECELGEKLKVYELESDVRFSEDPIDITLYGVMDDSKHFSEIPLEKRRNDKDNWNASFSYGVAKKLNVKVGDVVTFWDDYEEKEYQIRVADIVDYQGVMVIFMPQEELNEMIDAKEGSFNAYVSDEKLDIDEALIAKMVSREDMTGAAKQMLISFNEIIVIVSIFSVIVYMVLMYILTKVVVEKNAIHIAFMKVFGYEEKEISKLYLRATTVVVLLSLVICIPAEVALFKATLVVVMSMVEGWIDFYLPWTTYAYIILIGIVSYFVINGFHIYKVKKIAMSSALKIRE